MRIATAAEVAAALGVRYRPNGTPINAVCHPPHDSQSKSQSFRDPKQAGSSLNVLCWAGCHYRDSRHALQAVVGLPLCRCRECYERSSPSTWTPPRTRAPATPPTFERPSPRVHPTRIWQATVPVPFDDVHPARRWLAYRHLWRPQVPLPLTVRWLPRADLPRRNKQAAGALVLALARAGTRQLCAAHLVYVDADGHPVPAWPGGGDKNTEAGGVQGAAVGAVGVLGVLDNALGVNVAEGLADCLAIHARDPWPTVAILGTSGYRNLDVGRWLAGFADGRIWADPGTPGQAAARALGQSINFFGGRVQLVQTGGDADPGAAGAELSRIDTDELKRYADDLVLDGYPPHDAERAASVMLNGTEV